MEDNNDHKQDSGFTCELDMIMYFKKYYHKLPQDLIDAYSIGRIPDTVLDELFKKSETKEEAEKLYITYILAMIDIETARYKADGYRAIAPFPEEIRKAVIQLKISEDKNHV